MRWRAQDLGHETRPAELQVSSYSDLCHWWWVLQDYLQDLLATTAVSSLQQIGNRCDNMQLHHCTCHFFYTLKHFCMVSYLTAHQRTSTRSSGQNNPRTKTACST